MQSTETAVGAPQPADMSTIRNPALPPKTDKGHERAWTPEEDRALIAVLQEVGTTFGGRRNWSMTEDLMIERKMYRSGAECRHRLARIEKGLRKPGVNMCVRCSVPRKGHSCPFAVERGRRSPKWLVNDSKRLYKLVEAHGFQWDYIGGFFPGFPSDGLRRRFWADKRAGKPGTKKAYESAMAQEDTGDLDEADAAPLALDEVALYAETADNEAPLALAEMPLHPDAAEAPLALAEVPMADDTPTWDMAFLGGHAETQPAEPAEPSASHVAFFFPHTPGAVPNPAWSHHDVLTLAGATSGTAHDVWVNVVDDVGAAS